MPDGGHVPGGALGSSAGEPCDPGWRGQTLFPAAPSAPIRPVSAAEAVADRLIAAIAVGDYSPGDRLPAERELAEMLEVSRVTVRAALADLQQAGYVEVRRGRAGGSFVRTDWGERTAEAVRVTLAANWDHYEQLFDMRRLGEAMIARTAAERHTKSDDAAIAAALLRYEHATDAASARTADVEFHRSVARATHNPLLVEWSRQLQTQVSLGVPHEPFTPKLWQQALPQHRALAEAVAAGDVDEAAKIAGQHFQITERALRRAVRKAGRDPS